MLDKPMRTAGILRRHNFIVAYISNGFQGHTAAIAAGYSERSAKEAAKQILKHPQTISLLNALREKMAAKAENASDECIRDARTIKQRCMQAEPVKDPGGQPTGEYKFDSRGALGGNDQIAKLTGAYQPEKREMSGGFRLEIVVDD